MKRVWKKAVLFTSGWIICLGSFIACGRLTTYKTQEDKIILKGSIKMAGSVSLEKLISALNETFMEKYPNITVTAEFIGSSAGIEAVLENNIDIAYSSRALKEEEKKQSVIAEPIVIDGIAVCVDLSNKIENITKQQLIDIYTGKITNWKQLGEEDAPIVVIGREAGSGTRETFEELLDIKEKCVYANELNSDGAIIARVASIPGAIGYLSIDIINNMVIPLKLEGIEVSQENIQSGNYFLSRPYFIVVKEERRKQNELVQLWFDYVQGEEGKQVIENLGFAAEKSKEF